MAKKPNKILFRIGIGMILLGIISLVASVFGTVQQATIGVTTPLASVNVGGLSQTSVVMLFVGVVLVLLGAGIIGLSFKFSR